MVLIWMMMTDDDVLLLLLLMGCQRKLQEGRKIKRGIIFVKPKQSEKFRVFLKQSKKFRLFRRCELGKTVNFVHRRCLNFFVLLSIPLRPSYQVGKFLH